MQLGGAGRPRCRKAKRRAGDRRARRASTASPENKKLKVEKDILKKAAAWFAQETDSVPPYRTGYVTRDSQNQYRALGCCSLLDCPDIDVGPRPIKKVYEHGNVIVSRVDSRGR